MSRKPYETFGYCWKNERRIRVSSSSDTRAEFRFPVGPNMTFQDIDIHLFGFSGKISCHPAAADLPVSRLGNASVLDK